MRQQSPVAAVPWQAYPRAMGRRLQARRVHVGAVTSPPYTATFKLELGGFPAVDLASF